MSGQRCPKCGGYSWNNGICKNCGYCNYGYEGINIPRSPTIENIDVFKMAEAIKQQNDIESQSSPIVIPEMSWCPICDKKTLRYSKIGDYFECLNIAKPCPKYYQPIKNGTPEYEIIMSNFQPKRKK